MKAVPVLFLLCGLLSAACIGVPSDKILARDISQFVPMLQTLDPETVIGLAPFPGTERVLSSRDLVLAARHHGLEMATFDPPPSLCVERLVHSPSVEEVRTALLSALNDPAARLEIIEFSKKPLPPGHLVFSRAALSAPPGNDAQTPVVWPGKLIYDDQHSLSVWAKVRISVDGEVIIAKDAISKGDVIRADQVAITRIAQFPFIHPPPSSRDEIVGKVARRPIPAGQRIPFEALDEFKEVVQGETVHVKVVDGAATITFDAVAQSSGKKGECIFVHHPSNGKVFRARIEDRGQVLVIPAAGAK